MKTLTTEQLETLKTMDWQNDRGDSLFYFTNTDDNFFQNITDICVSCLRELFGNNNTMDSFYWEIAYRFHKEGVFYDLHYAIWCKGDVVKNGVIQEFNSDVLGLFTEEQEEEDPIENLRKAIQKCCDADVSTSDILGVIEDFDYIYDAIKTLVLDNIGVNDLPDFLIEDAGKEWVEENAADAYDRAVNSMESYEIRDKIVEYISDNL